MNKQILTKEFSLATVLGTISGYLLVYNGMDEIHSLIEWIIGEPVFTHQIPYVMPNIENNLKKQFPQISTDEVEKDIQLLVTAIKEKNQVSEAAMWIKLKTQYGSTFQVVPMQPFDEFEMPPLITPNIEGKVIIVETSSEEI